MGIALIVPDVNFADANLGVVTLTPNGISISRLDIAGPDSIVGLSGQYMAKYTPLNTYQRGVVWSIEDGGQYASIDSETGVVTVLQGASASNVTIKVTSSDNSSVFATKEIVVTYESGAVDYLSYIKVTPGCYVDTGLQPFEGMKVHAIGTKGAIAGVGAFWGTRGANNARYTFYWTTSAVNLVSPTASNILTLGWGTGFDNTLFEVSVEATTVKSKLLSEANWTTWKGTYSGAPQAIGYNMFLFCENDNGTPLVNTITSESALRQFTVYDNADNVVLDLRAVLVGNTPMFRDEVSGNLYPIEGTGTVSYERL